MATRTGLFTIRNLAYQICRKYPVWAPIIARVYPNNAALTAALEAAVVACQVLVEEVDGVRTYET